MEEMQTKTELTPDEMKVGEQELQKLKNEMIGKEQNERFKKLEEKLSEQEKEIQVLKEQVEKKQSRADKKAEKKAEKEKNEESGNSGFLGAVMRVILCTALSTVCVIGILKYTNVVTLSNKKTDGKKLDPIEMPKTEEELFDISTCLLVHGQELVPAENYPNSAFFTYIIRAVPNPEKLYFSLSGGKIMVIKTDGTAYSIDYKDNPNRGVYEDNEGYAVDYPSTEYVFPNVNVEDIEEIRLTGIWVLKDQKAKFNKTYSLTLYHK